MAWDVDVCIGHEGLIGLVSRETSERDTLVDLVSRETLNAGLGVMKLRFVAEDDDATIRSSAVDARESAGKCGDPRSDPTG